MPDQDTTATAWPDEKIVALARAAYDLYDELPGNLNHGQRAMAVHRALEANGLDGECRLVDGHPVPYSATLWRGDRSLCYLGVPDE